MRKSSHNSSSQARQKHCSARMHSGGRPDRRKRISVDEPTVIATIVDRQPDPSYPDGLSALADVLVLQMFDSGVGETLRMAYTIVQEHQERLNRRATLSVATEALREHLARLDETLDDL
jgi:hypothetical protein